MPPLPGGKIIDTGGRLKGVRVLVVDDEPLLLMDLEDVLTGLGCKVVGSAARLQQALRLARELDFDLAVLDVNLGDARVDALADLITERGARVVFVTGYGAQFAGRPWHGPIVEKPYDLEALRSAICQTMGSN